MPYESLNQELFSERRKFTKKRHMEFFLSFVKVYSAPIPDHYDALEEKIENIMNAFETAVRLRDEKTLLEFANPLLGKGIDGMLLIKDYLIEAEYICKICIQMVDDNLKKSDLMIVLSQIHFRRAQYEEAKSLLKESMVIKEINNDILGTSDIYHNMASIANQQGDYEFAKDQLMKSMDIELYYHQIKAAIPTIIEYASILIIEGNYEEAERYLYLAAQYAAEVSQDEIEFYKASLLSVKGGLRLKQHKLDEAEMLYKQSLAILDKLGNLSNKGTVLASLGIIAFEKDQIVLAEKFYRESIKIHESLGQTYLLEIAYHCLAELLISKNEFSEAEAIIIYCIGICESINNRTGLAYAKKLLGRLKYRTGDGDSAKIYLESLKLSMEIGNDSMVSEVNFEIGLIYSSLKQFDQALYFFETSLKIDKRIGNVRGHAHSLLQIGMIYIYKHYWQDAKKSLIKSLEIYTRLGDREKIQEIQSLLEGL